MKNLNWENFESFLFMQLFDKLILTNFIDFFSCAYTFCIYNYHKSQPFCHNFFSIENSLSQTFENLNFV